MAHAYPILIDLSERLVVIVGGGAVAARKAGGVLAAGARSVRVVAPAFDPAMPVDVERVTEAYRKDHLSGAGLVFAATDRPDVNESVVRDAQAMKILANRADADDEAPGDFTLPAMHQADRLVLTVSAGGSPALAAKVRDELAGHIHPRWVKMAAAMAGLRPLIRSSSLPIERRKEIFRWLASDEAMQLLDEQGMGAIQERIGGASKEES